MKNVTILCTLVSSVILCGAGAAEIAPKSARSNTAAVISKDNKTETKKFEGAIKSIDVEAKSITVDKIVILIVKQTKILNRGKPIGIGDLEVGAKVHGRMKTNDDGDNEAVRLVVKPKKNEVSQPAATASH